MYFSIFSEIKTVTDDLKFAEMVATAEVNGSTVIDQAILSNPVKGIEIKTELSTKTTVESKDSYIHSGDTVKYEINIKNIGNMDSDNLQIHDNISDYLDIKSVMH